MCELNGKCHSQKGGCEGVGRRRRAVMSKVNIVKQAGGVWYRMVKDAR